MQHTKPKQKTKPTQKTKKQFESKDESESSEDESYKKAQVSESESSEDQSYKKAQVSESESSEDESHKKGQSYKKGQYSESESSEDESHKKGQSYKKAQFSESESSEDESHKKTQSSESESSEVGSEDEGESEDEYPFYEHSADFLDIPNDEINEFVYYKDREDGPNHPIHFVILNRDLALIRELMEQKPNLNLESASNIASAEAMHALRNGDYASFYEFLEILLQLDYTGDKITEIMNELDQYLDSLSEEDLKTEAEQLLNHMGNVTNEQLLNELYESKYLNFLNTAFREDVAGAQADFGPVQLKVLSEVGFNYAKAKRSETGDKYARYFIKQVLEEPAGKQKVLFYQDLYIDNLEFAAKEINKKLGTNLKVNRDGLCSFFTKMWLSNEAQGIDQKQNQFFVERMEIAGLTQKEISDRIKSGSSSFINSIKNHARNSDSIQFNDEFAGQNDQRTMKKNFGLEYSDRYDLDQIDVTKSKYAYLRVRYTDGTGHAIGIHVGEQQKHGKTSKVYKVWDSNDSPRTFESSDELQAYLDSFKTNPKIESLSIYEFSPFGAPDTKNKVQAIDSFLTSISKLDSSNLTRSQAAIVNAILLLKLHYTNGDIVPLNDLVPLLAFLGNVLNQSGMKIDLKPLDKVIQQYSLTLPKNVDLNKLPYISELVESALNQAPPQPQIVTALFDLRLSRTNIYPQLSQKQQELVLGQAISEANEVLVGKLLELGKHKPRSSHVSLALNGMLKNQKHADTILARLLLTGKTLTDEDYPKLNKRPSGQFFGTSQPPAYKQTLKKAILKEVLNEIGRHKNHTLGVGDIAFLKMLDYALNSDRKDSNGCYDVLRSTHPSSHTDFREQIRQAFLNNDIKIDPSMKKDYPVLYGYLKPEAKPAVSYHVASDSE